MSLHHSSPRRLSLAGYDSETRPLIMVHPVDEETNNTDVEILNHDDVSFFKRAHVKAPMIRALALLCVCSLSVGSHYASYILGPLKSRLSREMGTSNTEFSLLLAALASSGTWTPLVGSVMVVRLGTATSSIIATGAIFLGQLLLLIGDLHSEVRLMTLGMFIFGLGTSPLAVVQETIIVQFFKSHSLGVSLALGLVAGKGASFLSARTSYPLSQYSPSAPFYVATAATGFSFIVNLFYLSISKWLVQDSGAQHEVAALHNEALREVAEKRRVKIREVFKLGDTFWVYIGLNILCGCIWSPFTHLASNIIERRFSLSELDASYKASYLLGGSVFLYPLCGIMVDRAKKRQIVIQLLACASVLTLVCFIWLSLPPTRTKTPWPAIIPFGTALGFATLLLVVIVPRLVPLEYVSTTLGIHKSLEHTGTTITQTITGLWLDLKPGMKKLENSAAEDMRLQWLLNGFVFMNVLQLLGIWVLAYLEKQRNRRILDDTPESNSDASPASQRRSLLQPGPPVGERYVIDHPSRRRQCYTPVPITPAEIKRGKICASLCVGLTVFGWVFFLVTSFIKIRSKQDREGH